MLIDESERERDTIILSNNLEGNQTIDYREFVRLGDLGPEPDHIDQRFYKVYFLNRELYIKNDLTEDATLGYTKELTIIHWSKSAERLLGYTEEEILGKKMHQLVPEDKMNEIIMIFDRLEHEESIRSYETVRRHKNGKLIPVVISVTPLYHNNGEFYGVFVQYRDISEKIRLLEQLKSTEELWRSAIQGGKFGVWEWHIDTDIFLFHNHVYDIYGLSSGEKNKTLKDWLSFTKMIFLY